MYSALELSLQRRVAVKILRPELASDDRFRERFLRESRLAASLEHPNIIPIYAAGEGKARSTSRCASWTVAISVA